MSRASVLLLALLIINTLLGSLCLAVAHGERDAPGLRRWGWGLLLYSAGILITLPEALPFDLRKVVGNALIAFAPILSTAGLLARTGVRLDRRWIGAAYALSVLPILYNHLGGHYLALVDFLAPAPIANVLFVYAAVPLLRRPPPAAYGAARFLAGILLFSVLVWTLRMAAIWTSVGDSNDRDRADLVIALFAIAQIIIAVAATLGLLWVEVRGVEDALRRQALADALTGIPNRRATLERFLAETRRAERERRSFALVVFDVDHFKRINDAHGHLQGDAALCHVAHVLDRGRGSNDAVGRVGGEEFVVLLDGVSGADAVPAADRLRAAVAATPPAAQELPALTVSGGVAVYPQDGRDWDQLFATADRRLYAAKHGGRNRVEGPPLAA